MFNANWIFFFLLFYLRKRHLKSLLLTFLTIIPLEKRTNLKKELFILFLHFFTIPSPTSALYDKINYLCWLTFIHESERNTKSVHQITKRS